MRPTSRTCRSASLSAALAARLDAIPKPQNADALVKLALDATAAQLHFGLQHRTNTSFDVAEREGNCIEYAELFATIISIARRRGSLRRCARTWCTAPEARVLGQRLAESEVSRSTTGRSWSWANRRLFVDPTLYDEGFGWDISRAVIGPVTTPVIAARHSLAVRSGVT